MEQLWAPWRLAYVQEAGGAEGCVFCREAAGELGDASLVVHRGERALVLLNKFPYSSGHLMVAPVRHIPALGDLDDRRVRRGPRAHGAGARGARTLPTGRRDSTSGWNLGAVAGGSISGHLHEHVVPRWGGDTNFMPVLADVKVLPEHLEATRARLTEVWAP